MSEFLELFDAYAAAREQMKAAPEGSREESYALTHCASLWNSLIAARAKLP